MNNNLPWGILTGIRPVKIAMKCINEGMTKNETIDFFKKTYGTSESKGRLAVEIALKEKPIIDNMNPRGISLYIGIPFCPTRCLYCSFITNSVKQSAKLIPQYLECLLREIEYTAEIVKEKNLVIESVYIGGGTPTTLSAEMLKTLIEKLKCEFDLSGVKEFTVEAGRPDTVDFNKLKTLRNLGVDRVSINPQTMNSETLKVIGRNHTPSQIEEAVNLAKEAGFPVINMDLIAGLPGENVSMFENTLNRVYEMNPENITVHTLSIKRSSRLREMLDKYELPSGEETAKMVELAQTFLKECGFSPYYLYRQKHMLGNLENIGYCKKNTESIYNIFIMEEVQTIIAMGCGGSTKTVDKKNDRIERIFNVKEPIEYINRIDEMLKRKDCLRSELQC